MAELDPAHVEAVARVLHDGNPNSGTSWGDKNGFQRSPYRVRARQILTSTDPAVHAALLAALVRSGILDCEASGGPIEPEGKRRYVTDWEDVDA